MERGNILLSSLERRIVITSLSSGKIPISIESEYGLPSTVEAKNIRVLENGQILIQRPTSELFAFAGEDITVSFVWNAVNLSFSCRITRFRAGLSFFIPKEIFRSSSAENSSEKKELGATLFFERIEKISENGEIDFLNKKSISAIFDLNHSEKKKGEEKLLSAWGANKSDEMILKCARFFLKSKENDKAETPAIIFVNSSKTAIFIPNEAIFSLQEGDERALVLDFPLPRPLKVRKIPLSYIVERVLHFEDSPSICAICKFSGARMEDVRFLHDHFK